MASGDLLHPYRDVLQRGASCKRREYGRDDFLPLPCSKNSVGGGLQAQYDGKIPNIPVPPETVVPVSILCSGPVGKFAIGTWSKLARRWSGHTKGDPHLSLIGGDLDASSVISACERDEGMPSRGVPGKGRYADGIVRALFALPR